MNVKKTFLICLGLVTGCCAMIVLIFMTEPVAQRTGAVRQTAMLVTVQSVERGTFRPVIRSLGTVEPEQDITLSPQVRGEVIVCAEAFVPGGHVKKGDVLLRIDPVDYENALMQRKSDLSQAMADLDLELGRQNVAQQDFQYLEGVLSEKNKALVLRKPQLDAARARVAAARAAVKQAERDLQRTTIRAPFDAHILSRNVNVGSLVSSGDNLGRLVGLETYWVVATVPVSVLRWVAVPKDGQGEGARVQIKNRTAWDTNEYREGRLHRLVGALEAGTRMARVLITVPDPQGMTLDAPPLMIGEFVEAEIEAAEMKDVVRLSRDYVRDNDTVWVMADGVLRIREADILFRDATHAYITRGLNDGDRVVTSDVSAVVDGAPLRLEGGNL